MRNHTQVFAGCLALLTAALLAVSCGEADAPASGAPPPVVIPDLDTLRNQRNGDFAQRGTRIVKGFNPTNPHIGDAIIGTFFWVGSSNIITSVTDYLTDGTPVGNTYALVDYVTAGNLSMATFVATNVRNFPDPNATQNTVLVVQANLATSVAEAGIMLSSYSGIQVTAGHALGGHHSASGASAVVTNASAGAIAVAAGALVYGVTLTDGVVGVAPPAGFTSINTLSDAFMKGDGRFAVQGAAGSVDPQWTWYFHSPSTWLATVIALNPPQ